MPIEYDLLLVAGEKRLPRQTEELLTTAGFRLEQVRSGAICLACLERHPPLLLLIIPPLADMDAQSLSSAVRRRPTGPAVPVVLFRTPGTDDVLADHYIHPPVTDHELLARLHDIAKIRRLEDVAGNRGDDHRMEEELKQVNQILATSRRNLHEAQQIAKIGSFEFDLTSGRGQWSEEQFRLLGYHPGEIEPNMELLESHIHPGDRHRVAMETEKLLKDRDRYQQHYRIITNHGGLIAVHVVIKVMRDQTGGAVALRGTMQDVTEQKQAEQLLNRTIQTLEMAQHMARLGYWSYDVKTRITSWSAMMYDILGCDPAKGPPSFAEHKNFIHGEDWETFAQAVQSVITTGKPYDLILRVVFPDGSVHHINSQGFPQFGPGGRINKLFGITLDITQIKRMEAEKQRLTSQLRQAQKMEAVGTLAGGIAHDFNNILTAVIGFSELAMDDAPADTRCRESINQILVAANRARDLVQQILTFSRQQEEETRPIQPGIIIKEALKLLRSSLPATITIKESLSSRGVVVADPSQIHQVIMNLSTNAAQAMEENGGILTVKLTDEEVESFIDSTGHKLKAGFYVTLTVADTGTGIVPEVLQAIFEPYFTTKEIGEGTGLGLAVVHGIVKSCGGGITVTSNRGLGTTFTVYLPKSDQRPLEKEKIPEPLLKGTERILLVDDEQPIVSMQQRILEAFGYRIITSTNPCKALSLFKENPQDIDLVITDMTMPDMTGDRLAGELINVRPDIPVILSTGFSKKITERTISDTGIRALALKPINKHELAALVRKVLDEGKVNGGHDHGPRLDPDNRDTTEVTNR